MSDNKTFVSLEEVGEYLGVKITYDDSKFKPYTVHDDYEPFDPIYYDELIINKVNFSLREVADLVGIGYESLRNHIRYGRVEAFKYNGRWFIEKEELNRFIKLYGFEIKED